MWRSYDCFPLLVRMGVQFHHLKVDALSGKVEVALELIPTFKSLLSSDVLKGTTGQSSVGCLRAVTLLTRLEVIEGEGGVCLRYSSQHILISALGLKLGPRVSGSRLKVQE